jgi:hypothetical protein
MLNATFTFKRKAMIDRRRGGGLTEDELILFLCREAGEEGSGNDLIKKFREKYRDHSELITKASQGDSNALRRLRWLCGLKVITKLGIREAQKG